MASELSTAEREAMKEAHERYYSLRADKSGGHIFEHGFLAARDFYGPERVAELQEALSAVGLPADASVEGLIRHHHANAEMKGAMDGKLQERDRSEQRERVLREALKRFGHHESGPGGCQGEDDLEPCTCGLSAALAVSPEQPEDER